MKEELVTRDLLEHKNLKTIIKNWSAIQRRRTANDKETEKHMAGRAPLFLLKIKSESIHT